MNLRDLYRFLPMLFKFDFGQLKRWLDLFNGFEEKGLEDKIRTVLEALKPLVLMTPTTVDDKAYQFLRDIVGSDAFPYFVKMVEKYLDWDDPNEIERAVLNTPSEDLDRMSSSGLNSNEVARAVALTATSIKNWS